MAFKRDIFEAPKDSLIEGLALFWFILQTSFSTMHISCQRGWWDDNLMMPPWQDNHHHDNQSQSRVSHDTRRPGTHDMTPVWHFLCVYNQLQTSLWSPLPLHPRVASWLWHRVWGWRSDGGCPLPSPHAGLTFDQNWKYYCQKPGIPISQSCHI